MNRRAHGTAWIAGALLTAAIAPAAAQSFNQAIIFGDSSVDSGYYKALASPGGGATYNSLWPSAVAAGAGAPTTNPGFVNSQFLAAFFGLTALPANQPGGTNYATSGAKDVNSNGSQNGGFAAAVPTVFQMLNYLNANGGHANSQALYLISSGGNDISFAIGSTGTGPFPSNPTSYVLTAAGGLTTAITTLQAAGARYIIVPDLNYSFPTGNTTADQNQRSLSLIYTQALWSGLAANGVNFIPADFNAVRLAIAANPGAFGFINVDTAPGHMACSQPAGVTTAWALLCSSNPGAPSHLVSPNAELTDLFADDEHYTTAGQLIEADYYYSLVVAPSMISMLAEAPLKTRAAVVDSIYNQVLHGDAQRGPTGINAWISGGAATLGFENSTGFPSDPGIPLLGTIGLDYGRDQWLVGAAVSLGQDQAGFAQGFGGFKQDEVTASLYGSYRVGPLWGLGVLSGGTIHDQVDRSVPIGITVQNNQGSTGGSNLSLAAFAGYDFTWDWLTHGPVAGITAQRVHIDGFPEFGSFTALAFGSQTRDSDVGALGYRASVRWDALQPFAQFTWNHEFANTDRMVTASLTTIAAPSYSMPAITLGNDWGTGSIGTTVACGDGCTALVGFTAQFGQQSASSYGGQVGLTISF